MRRAINNTKARVNSSETPNSLVISAAWDDSKEVNLSLNERKSLLDLNLNGSKIKQALPGYVPLYVGMPVILRERNISTELKINNGSRGTVCKIVSNVKDGLTNVSCVLVSFPQSPVQLDGLDMGIVPITPETCRFTHSGVGPDRTSGPVRISRSQIPLEPAFAVTGHCAQGKTLPKVIVNLKDGGFSAYVGASRAREQKDFCITEPVTLDDLNKPLPEHLIVENKRLIALAHNTLVQHGFKSGTLVPVPEPEFECTNLAKSAKVKIALVDNKSKKRSYNEEIESDKPVAKRLKKTVSCKSDKGSNKHLHDEEVELDKPVTKRSKKTVSCRVLSHRPKSKSLPTSKSTKGMNSLAGALTTVPNHQSQGSLNSVSQGIPQLGCSWDNIDHSCAYDAVFMSLYCCFLIENDLWFAQAINENPLAHYLINDLFNHQLPKNRTSLTLYDFNSARNALRDCLSNINYLSFPRHGTAGASVDRILAEVGGPFVAGIQLGCPVQCLNNDCGVTYMYTGTFQTFMSPFMWGAHAETVGLDTQALYAPIASWVSLELAGLHPDNLLCGSYNGLINVEPAIFLSTPAWLYLECSEDTHPTPVPSIELHIPTANGIATYKLRSIIYFGHHHFAARLIDNLGTAWVYDGMIAQEKPQRESSVGNIELNAKQYSVLGEKQAVYHIYSKVCI